MKPILYYYEMNSASRFVMMVAKEIGLDMEYRSINMLEKEHFQPEFVTMNPMHHVPTLDDGGIIIWDCHAICTYLVEKYSKTDKLYPKDLVQRAYVDQRLHFDCGFMHPRLWILIEPIFYHGSYDIPQEKLDYMERCYGFMESMFKTNVYLVGNHMTLGDLACFATFASMMAVLPFETTKYPKVHNWWKLMCKLPYYKELNQHGVDAFKKHFFECVEKNQMGI